ncbi:MAG: hypothetical protein NTW02_03310 [Cyanobium sp. LacPavin_0920_WC12_MAG_62_9]|nr:hypothetical protein [Cyanobium sp. LacPavin_0920_WC12_MAG_62_9]
MVFLLAPNKEAGCCYHDGQGGSREQQQDDGGPIGVHRCGFKSVPSSQESSPSGEHLVLLDRPLMGIGLGVLRTAVLGLAVASGGLVVTCATAGDAGVVFDNCQTLPGGAVSCNTRPTGNTRDNDEAARYGLFDQASPGWNEYDPYAGYNSM